MPIYKQTPEKKPELFLLPRSDGINWLPEKSTIRAQHIHTMDKQTDRQTEKQSH